MGHNVRDFVLSKFLLLDLQKLEFCLSGIDADWLEASLDIIKDTEILIGLGNAEHVHQTKWETWVSSCSVVNFDIATFVSADLDRLLAGESVSKPSAEQYSQWDALSELVWSSRWTGGEHTSKLVQAPCAWCCHSLQMLLWSSCLKHKSNLLSQLITNGKIQMSQSYRSTALS